MPETLQHKFFDELANKSFTKRRKELREKLGEGKIKSINDVKTFLKVKKKEKLLNDFIKNKINKKQIENLKKRLNEDSKEIKVHLASLAPDFDKVDLQIDKFLNNREEELSIKEDLLDIKLSLINLILKEYCKIPKVKKALSGLGHDDQTILFEDYFFFDSNQNELINRNRPHTLLADGKPCHCLDFLVKKIINATNIQFEEIDKALLYKIDFLTENITNGKGIWNRLGAILEIPKYGSYTFDKRVSSVTKELKKVLSNKSIFINLAVGDALNDYPIEKICLSIQEFWKGLKETLPDHAITIEKKLFIIISNSNIAHSLGINNLVNNNNLVETDCLDLGEIKKIDKKDFKKWANASLQSEKESTFQDFRQKIIINDEGLDIGEIITKICEIIDFNYDDFYKDLTSYT